MRFHKFGTISVRQLELGVNGDPSRVELNVASLSLGLSPGLDFETEIFVKEGAAGLLEKELAHQLT